MTTYHVTPKDQGQIVEIAYAAAGQYGVIRRTTDRSEAPATPTYESADWSKDESAVFEPWNGVIGADDSSWSPITSDRAARLLADEG